MNLALSGKDTEKSYGKFFFGSVQEHVWGDVVRQIGIILHQRKIILNPVAAGATLQEEPSLGCVTRSLLPRLSMTLFFRRIANNSRSVSDRGFALGWRPKAPSIEETLEGDVINTLEKYHLG